MGGRAVLQCAAGGWRLPVGCPDLAVPAARASPAVGPSAPDVPSRAMSLLDDYLARTPRSRALFERATDSMPGGSTRTTVYTAPYPPYIGSGSGLWLRDVDGNEYRDFLGNYTSLILGHCAPGRWSTRSRRRCGGARHSRRPPRSEVVLAEEIRGTAALGRTVALHELGNRGDHVRHPGGARIHRAFAGRPVRPLVPRHARRACMAGTPGVPTRPRRAGRRAAVGRPDGIEAALRGRRGRPRGDHHRARPGCRRRPSSRAGVPAVPSRPSPTGIGALLIFDEIISFRVGPERGAGAVRGRGRTSRRWARSSAAGIRSRRSAAGPTSCDLRRAPDRRRQPWRNLQRQPGRRRGRARDAPRADTRRLRATRATGRAPAGAASSATIDDERAGRAGHGRRFALPGLRGRRRDRVRDGRVGRTDPLPRACCSRGSTWRRAGWARSRPSRQRRTSTISRGRSAGPWPPCSGSRRPPASETRDPRARATRRAAVR